MNKKFNCPNFDLDIDKHYGKLLQKHSIKTFHEALDWVHHLSYRRISDLENLSLVAIERRGTCSSKHAFLAALAQENAHPEIQLELGYFKFSENNIPHFKSRFTDLKTAYILEAHCYLRCQHEWIDVTSHKFNPNALLNMNNPLETEIIQPLESGELKQNKHLEKFRAWSSQNNIDFEKAWQLRWDIIKYLVEQSPEN